MVSCSVKHIPGSLAQRNCPVHGIARSPKKRKSPPPTSSTVRGAVERTKFPDSKCVDGKGDLRVVYHGSEIDFADFDPAFTGTGNDAYGSGFYFAENWSNAKNYGRYIKSVRLNIENPIIVEGSKHMSLNDFEFDPAVVADILMEHPDILDHSEGSMNPIGDYAEEYWERDDWSKEEMRTMVQQVSKRYFEEFPSFTSVEGFFGRDNAEAFRKAVYKHTGYDGVKVVWPKDTSGEPFAGGPVDWWIAWFPDQIEVIGK